MTIQEIEALLWGTTDDTQLTDAEWEPVIRYVVRRLSEVLGQSTEIASFATDGNSFSCTVLPDEPLGGILGLEWRGVVGMQPIEGKAHVSATIFLFVDGYRLRRSSETGGSLLLSYAVQKDGLGIWCVEGWDEDEYGEYDGIEKPDDVQ